MRRPVLKKKADNSNDLLAIKLYIKQRNCVVTLSRKTKTTAFRNICRMVHLLRISGSFVNYFLRKKKTNFDDKITLMEKIKVVCKNDETAS